MLGFDPKAGPGHQLKLTARMLRNEKFAMKFAKHILFGKKPSDARIDAANELDKSWHDADDKTLQTVLRMHFKLKRMPVSNLGWRNIVLRWMIENPLYSERYRDLPPLTNVFESLASISRDSSVSR